jgi:FolB domain-containing protein
MDRILIEGLLARGILGINPEERENLQDIVIDVTLGVDTRRAAASDDIADAINYRTVTKAIIEHVETGQPKLVERLAAEIVALCLDLDERIEEVEVEVHKPGALRFAESVGIVITRNREDRA